MLNNFMQDISTLEVRTYTTTTDQVATDLSAAKIKTEGQAQLRAYSTISIDGDVTVLAPLDAAGEVSQSIWELHQATVKQALDNRATMIKTMGDAAAAALKALGQAGG
jgi:hypothetical protein